MQIGELAKTAEVPAKTIRYYEDIGLLPRPARTEGGFRRYDPEVVDLLRFIRKAQALGLTLAEIRELTEIRKAGNLPCMHLRSLLEAKVAELERRILELRKLRGEMRETLEAWDEHLKKGEGAVVCPHIEGRPDEAAIAFRTRGKAKRRPGAVASLLSRAKRDG
ncbi:MAG: heavy metal-responsive transcriptional regulator [Candidatus Tectomicrobia bacterium]|uniref:Heavy metal-responsive transcriptional regulator n=1 Tax=Tectimicrobiota bacterium TaxID=2528274 RepID=A0A932HUY1_UNCTE|nr:heavy metal-responsive transcriptional regulator [Candidatus Tectomicrobia bacterium]